MDTLRAAQGITTPFQVTLRDGDGNEYLGYQGNEMLAALLWAGEDMAAIAGAITPAWPGNGLATCFVNLTVNGEATASLEPATYRVRLLVAGENAYEGSLELDWSPGAATAPTQVYCTFADMKRLVPTIGKYAAKLEDEAGFLQQRIEATSWFQDLVQRNWRGGTGLNADFAFVPGVSFLGAFPGAYAPLFRPGIRSAVVQGWLDAGGLDLTPQVIRACAAFAVAQVGEAMVLVDPKGNWMAFTRMWAARAEDWAALITAEIDSDGDGTNDRWVRLGVYDTLEG